MVQLQLCTAARPGEIVSMRLGDVNTAAPIWEFLPRAHKTEHHEKGRVILIGPKGQAILREFLSEALAGLDSHVFSPADAAGGYPANLQPSVTVCRKNR